MQTYEKWLDPETLELKSIQEKGSPAKPSRVSLLLSALNSILQCLSSLVISNDELKIWQTRDWQGQIWWHAFDPKTGHSTYVATEDEMRVWLEKRYYK